MEVDQTTDSNVQAPTRVRTGYQLKKDRRGPRPRTPAHAVLARADEVIE
jgi:hypothetical protein